MGPGHLGLGLAAQPAAPKAPLWTLLVASEALDLLSLGFMTAGLERQSVSTTDLERGVQVSVPGSVPWSHGLGMSLVWSVIAAALAFLFYRDRRTSVVIGLLILSHWGLDFIVHPPDLPLLGEGSPTVGLGLWTSGRGLVLSALLELVLLAGGISIYRINRSQAAPDICEKTA
jgi:hypothetical protein